MSCAVMGCTSGGYWIKKWKWEYCRVCDCRRIQCKCKCDPPFRLFNFPNVKTNPDKRELWRRLLNRSSKVDNKLWTLPKDSRVCSLHFLDGKPTIKNPYPTLKLGYPRFEDKVKRILYFQYGDGPRTKQSTHRCLTKRTRGRPRKNQELTDPPGQPNVLGELMDDGSTTQPVLPIQEKVYMDDNHSSHVMSNLSQLWQREQLCDAAITNGTVTVKTHKAVLAAACPILLSLKAESTGTMTVNIPSDIKRDTISAFLIYIYDGMLRLTVDIVPQMVRLAKLMKEDTVLGYCEDFQRSVVHVPMEQETVQPNLSVQSGSMATQPLFSSNTLSHALPFMQASILCQSKASFQHVQTVSSLPHTVALPSSALGGFSTANDPSSSPNESNKILTSQEPSLLTDRSLLSSGPVNQHSFGTPCYSDSHGAEANPNPSQLVMSCHFTETESGTGPLPSQTIDNNPKPGRVLLVKSQSDPHVYQLLSLKSSSNSSSLPACSILPLTKANLSNSEDKPVDDTGLLGNDVHSINPSNPPPASDTGPDLGASLQAPRAPTQTLLTQTLSAPGRPSSSPCETSTESTHSSLHCS